MRRFPPKIKDGTTIGLVSPASPALPERINKGVAYLQSLGFKVKLGDHIGNRYGYLAGSDEQRAADINHMFADPDIAAVFCTRGGYGTPRLLEYIDFDLIASTPKVFVGFSDITALQLALYKRTHLVTYSGPMAAVEMGEQIDPFTESHFWPLLKFESMTLKLKGSEGQPLTALRSGIARGVLLGGNLSMLCSMVGTPFYPDFEGAILVVEDVGEEPYRLDRKFRQLQLAGIFDRISGLVLGQFSGCESEQPALTIDEIVFDTVGKNDMPIVTRLPYGHVPRKYTLPWGCDAVLDADKGIITVQHGE